MGRSFESNDLEEAGIQMFVNALLRDARALEVMPESSFDENRRIGAEQEVFLVDASGRPAPIAMDLLACMKDPRCATELARFNLEANLGSQVRVLSPLSPNPSGSSLVSSRFESCRRYLPQCL